MNRSKPIAVYKDGGYICTVMGLKEAAKIAGIKLSWASEVYRTGYETKDGYSFDDIEIGEIEFNKHNVLRYTKRAVDVFEFIGHYVFMAREEKRLQELVETSNQRTLHVLQGFDKERKLFIDTEGRGYRFAYPCPPEIEKKLNIKPYRVKS